jgi:hypothetical protein
MARARYACAWRAAWLHRTADCGHPRPPLDATPPPAAAIPLVYELDADLKPVKHYYLGDEAAIKAKMAEVAAQGTAKKH